MFDRNILPVAVGRGCSNEASEERRTSKCIAFCRGHGVFRTEAGSGEEKDSSAAAIAICGMLELIKYLPEGAERTTYEKAILLSMESLYENYSTKDCPESNGLLLHAVYSKPDKVGIDECNIWGCYFYLEALTRLKKYWRLYW